MADVLFSKSQNQYYARLPGNRYIPLDGPEQAEIVREGGVEALLQGAANTVGKTVYGAGTLLGVPGAEERFREVESNQAVREATSPTAGFAGSFVPDVVIGAATGGTGTLARRAGLTAAVEGGLGAAQNPDNPLLGGALGAAGGAVGGALFGTASPGARKGIDLFNTIENQVTGRTTRRAEIRAYQEAAETGQPVKSPNKVVRADDGINAARNVNATGELTEKILGKGIFSSDYMLDRYGMPTSQAQKTIIDTGDPMAFNAARAKDNDDFNTWRARGGGKGSWKDAFQPIDDYGSLRVTQQDAVNRAVMEAMGSNKIAASRNNIGDARRQISNSYNEIAKRAGPIQSDDLVSTIDDMIEDAGAEGPVANALTKAQAKIARELEDGYLAPDKFLAIKNEIAKLMRQAYGREPNLELGDALRQLDDMMDTKLMQALDAEDRTDMMSNRHKWAVANTALRTSAATNARGDINLRSFINAYRQGNRGYKIGYDKSEFAKFLDTADAIMFRETRDSGTPQGNAALVGMLLEGAGMAGIPGANTIGGLLR